MSVLKRELVTQVAAISVTKVKDEKSKLKVSYTAKYSQLFKVFEIIFGEFDSGSERTLAAWIRHASRTGLVLQQCGASSVAQGCVTRGQSAGMWGIARRKAN